MDLPLTLQRTLRTTLDHQRTLAWSPDGIVLASAGATTLFIWDASSGSLARSIMVPEGVQSGIVFSPDGHRLAAVLGTGAVGMWKVQDGTRLPILSDDIFSECVAWSSNRDMLAAVTKTGVAGLWESYGGNPETRFRIANPPSLLAWSADSQCIAAASGGSISLFNTRGALLRRFAEGASSILALAWSPSGSTLAFAGEDTLVRLWDASTGELLHVLAGHEDQVVSLAFCCDGTLLGSKSADNTVCCWETASGKPAASFQESAAAGSGASIAFHPSENRLASIDGQQGEIRVRSFREPAAVEESSGGVFISYSHLDKKYFGELKLFLNPLEDQGLLEAWDDTKMEAGDTWKKDIDAALASSGIAVLLVTQNFLASDFVMKHELPRFLERASAGKLTLLWIAVSSSNYHLTAIEPFQALNDPRKPLDMLPPGKRRGEWTKVADKINAAYAHRNKTAHKIS